MQATHGQMLKQFVACIFHLFVISLATGNCFQGLKKTLPIPGSAPGTQV